MVLLIIQDVHAVVDAMTSNKEVGTRSQKSSDNDAQGNASSSDSTTATSSLGNGDNLRYISKYLVQYVPDARHKTKRLQ